MLVGNDDMIDGQWEYLDEKQRRAEELDRIFEGATPENSHDIGQRMMEASNELTQKID